MSERRPWWPFAVLCAGLLMGSVGMTLVLFGFLRTGFALIAGVWAAFFVWTYVADRRLEKLKRERRRREGG